MKKISKLLLIIILFVMITGCGEDKLESKTCTRQTSEYHETSTFTAVNDEIEKIDIVYVYENSIFGMDTLSTLTDEQKEMIKSNMLTTLELDSDTYDGFEVGVDIQDQMTVSLKIDLTKADPEVLKKVGMDFSNADMSFKTGISSLEDEGYTCK